MASLVTFLQFPSLSSSPNTFCISPKRCPLNFKAQISVNGTQKPAGVAVVWLKHDLRIDDHPALLAASNHSAVVPIYVFDHRIISRFPEKMQETVLIALQDLRSSLKDKGANLMIRLGNAENVIQELVKEVQFVSTVYAEEEVEYGLRKMTDSVRDTLAAMRSSPNFVLWRTPFYDVKSLKGIPDSYDEFTKLRLPVTLPLSAATLTDGNMEVDWGPIPTFNDLKQFIKENPCKMEQSWNSMKEMCTETILMKEFLKPGQRNLNNSSSRHVQFPSKKRENSMFVTTKGNSLGGGMSNALKALGAYLRYLEGTERDHYWWKIHEQMPCAESRDGASFTTLFGPALFLGILSRRRVYFETLKYKKEQDSGFLSPFGYSSATIAATVDSVCSMEWYLLVALKSQLSDDRRFDIRIWRWKGYLIQYTVVGEEGPATLLVHGFGAFLEHYRDNIRAIAEGGNRVWAITLLGFGKSEKPNIEYTELMWAEMLRDFIIEVVGESAHLVGNSIGGYIIAIVARLWPALVKSVVLINSGGNVIPGYSSVLFAKERRTSGASWLGAKFLLFYLRLTLKDIVKNCYPSKTERVDNWLIDEMLRASYDPTSHTFDSTGKTFNISRVLNETTFDIDLEAYNNYSKLYLSTFFAFTYGLSFATLTATISHVGLFHGKSIWHMWKKTASVVKDQVGDIHTRLMKKNYDSVPQWWFQLILVLMVGLSIFACEGFGKQLQLPWWGVLMACGIALFFTLPIGIIQATTNQQPGLNVITELVIGYIYPGKPLANVAFKTYGYISMAQALTFLGDFKLGHYMKIPPKSMFMAQLVGTVVASGVYFGTAWWLLESIEHICDTSNLPEGSPWTCPGDDVFYNASIIWGVIGPLRMFTSYGVYKEMNWFFLIGLLAPVPVWFLSKKFPNQKWIRLINMPIILGATGNMPPAKAVHFITWFTVGIFFSFYVYKRHKGWWARHNYILSAALDAGLAFMGVLMYFSLQSNGINGPQWWGLEGSDHCPLAQCPTAPGVPAKGCPVQ